MDKKDKKEIEQFDGIRKTNSRFIFAMLVGIILIDTIFFRN